MKHHRASPPAKSAAAALLLSLLSLGWPTATAQAQTINWGSTASTSGLGNKHFTSDGSDMADGFTFQLGYFDGGFLAADPFTWASSWHVYDDASTGGIEGQSLFTSPSGLFGYNFTGSTTITDSAFDGKQGYIFGFNSLANIGTASGEALILTGFGNFPAPGNNVALDWTVDSTTTVVWGAIDTNVGTPGGELIGGGLISNPKASDSYHVQTASFSAVPEPSSALLLLSTGFLVRLRRKRLGHPI